MPKKLSVLSLADFEIIGEIGSGATGTVYKVKPTEFSNIVDLFDSSSEYYALKKIKLDVKCSDLLKEVLMMKNIHHPHIIKCYNSFTQDGFMYIIMEYANGGDLLSMIEKQKDNQRFFSEKVLWRFAWQMACGILHLHSNGIIHRDIKAMNVLIHDGVLKIGDLGKNNFTFK